MSSGNNDYKIGKRQKESRAYDLRGLPLFAERILLSSHICGNRPDDRQHEFLVLVCLIHHENPESEHQQSQKWIDRQRQKSHGHKVEHSKQNSNHQVDSEKSDRHSDGLNRVKSNEGTLVDQKKNQSCDPAENVTKEPRHVLLQSPSRGRRYGSSGCRHTLSCATLRTKRCSTHFCTARATKGHRTTSKG